jgi:hypothetical protein
VCAAKNGHFDCLKYAHENGCKWDEWTCKYAAGNGHFDCLKYAHENGCSLDGHICLAYLPKIIVPDKIV